MTLTAARGGIVQFNGPLFVSRRLREPLAACLWPLIRLLTGGGVFLSFLVLLHSTTPFTKIINNEFSPKISFRLNMTFVT